MPPRRQEAPASRRGEELTVVPGSASDGRPDGAGSVRRSGPPRPSVVHEGVPMRTAATHVLDWLIKHAAIGAIAGIFA